MLPLTHLFSPHPWKTEEGKAKNKNKNQKTKNKTKQNKAKQSKAKQSKAKQIYKQTIKQTKMIVYKQTNKNDGGGDELKFSTLSKFNVYKFLKLSQIVSKQVLKFGLLWSPVCTWPSHDLYIGSF